MWLPNKYFYQSYLFSLSFWIKPTKQKWESEIRLLIFLCLLSAVVNCISSGVDLSYENSSRNVLYRLIDMK